LTAAGKTHAGKQREKRMLGNCILRNPIKLDGMLDKGALCESLLFFGKAHLMIDLPTLGTLIKANFIDDLIVMLKAGYLTANFSPQSPALYNEKKNGPSDHIFTVIKITGDQQREKIRNPEQLESQLIRQSNDPGAARRNFRELADLISFDDVGDNDLPALAHKDICDPFIAKEVARMTLRAKGIPDEEIKFSFVDVLPLAEKKFMIATDIDFSRLQKFIPEADRATFNQDELFPAIGDARFDIGVAASQNAAFVGNGRNEAIINMILQRSLGVRFDSEKAPRQIYDFISVATPSIREVINDGQRTPREFIDLMEKASTFQKWLKEQNPTADLVKEMLREKARADWLESLPIKAMRFGLFTGAGMLADVLAPGASVVTGAIDAFVVDQVRKRWRPHYFVENSLRGFLEKKE
jgi:hypothetical protein